MSYWGEKMLMKENDDLKADLAAAQQEIERLKAGLREARDALDTAWRQAGDYFYDKYAEADLAAIDALLKEPKP